MTNPLSSLGRSRTRPARPRSSAAGPRAGYTVVQETNHYTVRDGRIYRDTIVRRADGALRLFLIPTEAAA